MAEVDSLYRSVLALDQNHVTTLSSYGAFLFDVMGDVRGSRDLLQRAVSLDPQHAPSLTSLASILQAEGAEPAAVEEVFLRAIHAHQELLSQHPLGYGEGAGHAGRGTGVNLDTSNQHQQQVASTEAAACCSSFAGWLWEVRKETSRAATLWGAALSIDPSNLAALRGASRLFAHIALSSASAAGPEPVGAERRGEGDAANPGETPGALGKHAEELYRKAIALEPRHVATRYNYAAFLHRLSFTNSSHVTSTPGASSASFFSGISSPSSLTTPSDGPSVPCSSNRPGTRADDDQRDLAAEAKGHYWEVLRLYPAHPPALCSLAALLQAEAENLKQLPGVKEGADRQGARGRGTEEAMGSGERSDRAGAACASPVEPMESVGTDPDSHLTDQARPDTLEGASRIREPTMGEEVSKERAKLIFMAEELLLTAAEVVEHVTYDASGAVVQDHASSSETAGPGARGERWGRHKAQVWTAYGGFLGSCKEDVSGAARAYLEALKVDPYHGTALLEYGELAATKMKNPRVAEYLYRQLLNVVPGVAEHWRGYGEVLQQIGNDAEAELAFKRALQMAPSDPSVLCSYATLLQSARRDCGGAELLYRRALDAQPRHTAALSNYGLLLEEFRADYAGAEELYRRALAVDPHDVTVLCHTALLRLDAHRDPTGAEALFTQALKLEPASVPALSNMASFQFAERRNVDYAEKLFKRALQASPGDVATLINYGSLLEEGRRDRSRAQDLFDLAMAIDPVNAERWLLQRDTPPDLGSESDLERGAAVEGAASEELRECRSAGPSVLADGREGDEPRIQVIS